MHECQIRIKWDSKSANETASILEEGLTKTKSNFAKITSFKEPPPEESYETLSLDAGITIAIVNSSVALAISLVSAIAQVISSKEPGKSQQMEVCLRNGTKIVIPANADETSMERLLKGLKDVRAIEIESMLISKIPAN